MKVSECHGHPICPSKCLSRRLQGVGPQAGEGQTF